MLKYWFILVVNLQVIGFLVYICFNKNDKRNMDTVRFLEFMARASSEPRPIKSNKPQIKVFITKTMEFRAKIRAKKGELPYEVTIGGKSWQEGKGREYEKQIMLKCELMLIELNKKLIDLKK